MSIHLAAQAGEIAPHALMPGDPLRAQWIAETFLDEPRQYNTVRNMFGYTGSYQGIPVSVQGSGMGQPSMSIYATELMQDYEVKTIIRVGTCGAISSSVGLRDVIIANTASTDSAMNRHRFHGIDFAPGADFALLRHAVEVSEQRGLSAKVGGLFSSDLFYNDRPELAMQLAKYGVLAIEMEASALYTLALKHGAQALTVATVSDHILTGEATSAQERQETFGSMIELALETVKRNAESHSAG
ncbi:purine-nucleoside phosphorylase [Psychromicrobium silvestre]|uniref:Uridine phosphorylase n=1 Tax=Psychromicrobium silvestre TaxID=1645614 RepID=A0A7Y9S6U6_9MICC|nr:purine-nucleoside phosphorylase [Psychromicrobium silvestre]NYE95643.1 purine-nucleoside phosphorylase [Psychromicrobium silvestre]